MRTGSAGLYAGRMRVSSRLDRPERRWTNPSPPTIRSTSPPSDGEPLFWLLIASFVLVAATIHALIMGIGTYYIAAAIPVAKESPDAARVVVVALTRMATFLPAVSLLLFLQRRFVVVHEHGFALRTIGALVTVATLEWWLFLAAIAFVDRFRGADVMAIIPTHAFGIGYRVVVLGAGMLLFSLGSQWRRVKSLELRAAEAEAALRTSELERLEAQLQPHFLFNALTAVLACRHDPEAVASVTIGLSEHLRACLGRQGAREPLSREIDALQHYLTVQRARFGRRLECRIGCTEEARGVFVPPVIVEPLLDNALKHGAVTSDDPLRIAVDCRIDGTALVVTVDNSGRWIEPGSNDRRGTGLANLRERLRLLDLHGASLDCGPFTEGVRARLRLPIAPPPDPARAIHTVSRDGQGR